MKIAVTGATGQLGQRVIQHLLKRTAANNIVALVRNRDKAQTLLTQGIEVRLFDYDQSETLTSALHGIDKLLLISANEIGRRTAQHRAVIEAAKQANIPYIAYTSLLHAETSPIGLAAEHRETEQLIRESGINYTVLRNNWYTENYTASAAQAVQQGILYGAAADAKISSATRDDYAEAAAAVLTLDIAPKQIYELSGSHAYTLADLAKTIAQVSGQPVTYQNLAATDYHTALINAGLAAPLVDVIVDADRQAQQGALYSDSKDLEYLLGRPTTSLEDAVRTALLT